VLTELPVPTVDIKMLLKLLLLDLEAHPPGAPVAKVRLRTEPIQEPAKRSSQAAASHVNNRNASTTIFDTSSRFRFVTSSWPAPVTGSSSVRAGMSFNAATTSSMEPKPSRVP
jgi:hypothetical protein